MYIIRPVPINDTRLISSNVAEDDYPEYAPATTYATDDIVIVIEPNVHTIYKSLEDANTGNYPPLFTDKWENIGTVNRWKAFNEKIAEQTVSGITPDILDDDCSSLDDWTEVSGSGGEGIEIDTGQFRFYGADPPDTITINRTFDTVPDQFTIEVIATMDTLNTGPGPENGGFELFFWDTTWRLFIVWGTAGLYIDDTAGTSFYLKVSDVEMDVEHKWRFQVDKTIASASTIAVYLDDVYVTTEYCGLAIAPAPETYGKFELKLLGESPITPEVHVNSIKIGTGLGAFSSAADITYTIAPGDYTDSIAILNLDATSVNITVDDPVEGEVYNENTSLVQNVAIDNWYDYFFSPIVFATDLVKIDFAASDLPNYPDAEITITISNTAGPAKVGLIVIGKKFEIGSLEYGARAGITDYSTVSVDTYGVASIIPRDYAKRMTCTLLVKNLARDEIARQMTLHRTTPVVWVGSERAALYIIYGIYKNHEFDWINNRHSKMELEVLGYV
jgi:hypothetical protein